MSVGTSNNPESGLQDTSLDDAIGSIEGLLDSDDAVVEEQSTKEVKDKEPEQENGQEVDGEEHDDVDEDDEDVDNDEEDDNDDEDDEDVDVLEIDESTKFEVKVDGKDEEVDLKELKAGYSRQSDYTKKTAQLAKDRREFEDEKVTLQNKIDELETKAIETDPELTSVNSQIAELNKTDWVALAESDADAFGKTKMKLEALKMKQSQLKDSAVTKKEAAKETRDARIAEYSAKQLEVLAEKAPHLANNEPRMKELRDYASTELGFSPKELEGTLDHRILMLLDKAKQLEEVKASATTKKQKPNKTKVVRSKASRKQSSSETTRLKRAQNNLSKNHSMDAALELIAANL